MIDYNGDVLVALPAAGFINTDVDKVLKAPGTLRFDLIQCPVDTSADSSQSIRMYSETVLRGRQTASHPTVRSKSFVKPLPG